MALEHASPLLTYEDYMALPEERHELLDGVLLMTPASNIRHQRLQTRLAVAIEPHVRRHRLGAVYVEADVVFRREFPPLILRPDLIFIARGRGDILTPANVQGVPDLIVEILSPSNPRHDTVRKRQIYADRGVREYWMVLNEVDQIEVLRGEPGRGFGRPEVFEAGDVLTTPLLPGLDMQVGDLFEPEDMG